MEPSVIVYTRDQCPECERLTAFLDRHGVLYEERNTSRDAAYIADMDQDDLSEIPTVIIFGTAITGFRPDLLSDLLGL